MLANHIEVQKFSYELCERSVQSPLILDDMISMTERNLFPEGPKDGPVTCELRFYFTEKGMNEIMHLCYRYGEKSIFNSLKNAIKCQSCSIAFYLKTTKPQFLFLADWRN